MLRRVGLDEARSMVRSRADLLTSGVVERDVRAHVQCGALIRLHRGWYVAAAEWNDLWPEGKHLLHVLAVHAASPAPGPIFTHASAAVVLGLPLHLAVVPPVQVAITGRRHSRTEAGVVRRDIRIDATDIIETQGIRVTSPIRTTVDVARTMRPESAISCADGALRQAAVDGHVQDADRARDWRAKALSLAKPGLRGVCQARRMLEVADGRAQLPGESVSRLQLLRLGYNRLDLQVPVTGSTGKEYWLDFGFLGARVFGEFDGEDKYLDASMRADGTVEKTLLREKEREDDVRGVTGWRFARWGYPHIRTPSSLGARLVAFGVRPPG